MFNKYFGRYPLMNEVKPTKERIDADKAAVLARIGGEAAVKPRRDRTVRPELYEITVPKETPRRASAAELIGKAAAVALAIGAGALVLNLFSKENRVSEQQPSAGSAPFITDVINKESAPESLSDNTAEALPRPALITKKFDLRREEMTGDLLINNEPAEFIDGMAEFKLVGLAAEVTDDGGVLLTRNDESPDLYYYMVEFSTELSSISVFCDTDGNGRVYTGKNPLAVEANGVNETGMYHAPHRAKVIEGSTFTFDAGFDNFWDAGGECGRGFDKRMFAVSEKGKLVTMRYYNPYSYVRKPGCFDIFELENGEFIFYIAPDWYDLYSVQCNSHGVTNNIYYQFTHPEEFLYSNIDFSDYFDEAGEPRYSDEDQYARLTSGIAKYLSGDRMAEYEDCGLTAEEYTDGEGERKTVFRYNGQKVRYLCDFVRMENGCGFATSTLFQSYTADGTVDIYAQRGLLNDVEQGRLKGFRQATAEQFDALKPEYFRNGIAIPGDIFRPLIFNEPFEWYRDTEPESYELNGAKDLPVEELLEKYGSFGVTYDADKNPIYGGEKVRYFCDLIKSRTGRDKFGNPLMYDILYASYNEDGSIDLYTVYDDSGTIVGLRVADQAEFDTITGAFGAR